MPVTRNTRSNMREVVSSPPSQCRPTSNTAQSVTEQFQRLKITSSDNKKRHGSRFSKSVNDSSAGQPTDGDQLDSIHLNPLWTTPASRPAKKGLRRDLHEADPLVFPPRFGKRSSGEAECLMSQQTEGEQTYPVIPTPSWLDSSVSTPLVEDLATSLSPMVATTYLPPAPAAEEPEYGYLDVDSLKQTLDGIVTESDDGSEGSSIATSSLLLPTSPMTDTLPSVVSHETIEKRHAYGKVETTKVIKQHRSSTPYASVNRRSRRQCPVGRTNATKGIPLAVVLEFNRINGTQFTQEHFKELLKYRSPDPRKVYRANPGNPQKAKEILAAHRIVWGLYHNLRVQLDQCDLLGYEAEDEDGR
ncbi:hypothetical protein FRC17_007534 [Serendipita sp. 399]|nr:hypothetical protein FRC17_007534 [Serendipita sp. 399]